MDTGIGATNASSAEPGKRRRLRLGRALFCTVIAFTSLTAYGQQPGASAYQIEAVYLYDFSKFVEWPTNGAGSRNEPFSICVLGEDPFGALLDATLSGESIQGSTLVAKRISKPEDAADCKIVFVSNSEQNRLKEILTAFDGANILTVSDIRDFSQRGGMIQFVVDGGKVRFEVNVKNAENAGLTLSSDLLEVALAVR
ncbi:MAG TPA: YfiR family protein, partial [Candidatus Acidoferrales bacterium]|nr:YfiR family protein [Candidatus Acidoferrales bacterium]